MAAVAVMRDIDEPLLHEQQQQQQQGLLVSPSSAGLSAPRSPDVAALAAAEVDWSSSCLSGLRELQAKAFDALQKDIARIESVEAAKPVRLPPAMHDEFAGVLGLQQPVAALADPEAPPVLDGLTNMEQRFQDLRHTSNEDRVRIFRSYIETLRMKTREVTTAVQDTQLDAEHYASKAAPSIDMLRDFMNEKRHHAVTAKVDEDIAKGLRRVDGLSKETDTEEARWMELPGEGGALPASSPTEGARWARGATTGRHALPSQVPNNTQVLRYKWLTAQYDDIFDANAKVLKMYRAKAKLLHGLLDSNAAFSERGREVRATAEAEIGALVDETNAVAATCTADIAAVDAYVDESLRLDVAQTEEYEAFRDANDQALAENEDAFEAVWTQLFELEAELRDLGTTRAGLVSERVDRIVAERQRQVELERMLDCGARHRALLENQTKNCGAAIALLDFVRDTVVYGADKGVAAQRKNHEEQLRDLIVDVQRKELDLYRSVHRKMGDLIQRNELFGERLKHGMASSWQIRTLYSTTHRDILEDIEQLREFQRQMGRDFAPTEAALHEAGVAFMHPSAEDESDAMKDARAAYATTELRKREDYELRRLERALEVETRSTARPYPEALEDAIRAVLTDEHPSDACSGTTTAVLAPTRPDPRAVIERELQQVVLSGPLISSAATAARAKLEAFRRADAAAGVDGPGAAAAAGDAAGSCMIPHSPQPPAQPRGVPRKVHSA